MKELLEQRFMSSAQLPRGSLSLTDFVKIYKMPTILARHYVFQGDIATTRARRGSQVYQYLTPEQQRAALLFWEKQGLPYRKEIPAIDGKWISAWLRVPPEKQAIRDTIIASLKTESE